MHSIGVALTFRSLLERYDRVRVPIVQRDYVQGLDSEGETRRAFLHVLRDAISRPANDPELPVNLDFIYGNTEAGSRTSFLPLDGQQRLTTLFLLHWYLAWRDREHDQFDHLFIGDIGCRFSYRVRPSSADFLNALAAFRPEPDATSEVCVSALVKDQPWYFQHWRLDPTIRAAVEMLDAMHSAFAGCDGGFLRLVDRAEPAITFQLLELREFGLSDDLYIKMNARGKGLTEFEAFKARYREHVEAQFDGESRRLGSEDMSVAEYFVRRMDTGWADLFWRHRRRGAASSDREVMNLILLVAAVSRNPSDKGYGRIIRALRDRRARPAYRTLERYACLDRRLSEDLMLLLDTWSGTNGHFSRQLPDSGTFDELGLFRRAITQPSDVSYAELVQLFGYLLFVREHDTSSNQVLLREWMRIVVNLSTNTTYDRVRDLQRSVQGLTVLAANSGDVLAHFAQHEKPVSGFSEQQIEEERLKANLICVGYGWRTLIGEAEGHGYFNGQIGFLLEFSGAREAWTNGKHDDRNRAQHEEVQSRFRRYMRAATAMFTAKGLADLGEHRWERALLAIGDYMLPRWLNYSFLVNPTTENASWKALLRAPDAEVEDARRCLRKLWDGVDFDGGVAEQLDRMIDAADGLEEWRQTLVKGPKAIAYCGMREIRWESEDEIYLLKKRQMNGAHAELFTYCLFVAEQFREALSDRVNMRYVFATDTYTLPGIEVTWVQGTSKVTLKVERRGPSYVITANRQALDGGARVEWEMPESLGFQAEDGILRREIAAHGIEATVVDVVGALVNDAGKE